MAYGSKTGQQIRSDIFTVEEYLGRVFGTKLDLLTMKGQVEDLVIQKIQDYIHQRYRDWGVKDLLALVAILEQIVVERTTVELEPEPVQNRRARSAKLKNLVEEGQ